MANALSFNARCLTRCLSYHPFSLIFKSHNPKLDYQSYIPHCELIPSSGPNKPFPLCLSLFSFQCSKTKNGELRSIAVLSIRCYLIKLLDFVPQPNDESRFKNHKALHSGGLLNLVIFHASTGYHLLYCMYKTSYLYHHDVQA